MKNTTNENGADTTSATEPTKRKRAARLPLPRRISPEVSKAETVLLRMQVDGEASVLAAQTRWTEKRLAFIRTLPSDVLTMLLSGGIVTDDDLEDLDTRGESFAADGFPVDALGDAFPVGGQS